MRARAARAGRRWRGVSSWLLVLMLAGCGEDLCARHTDCAANQMCSIDGRCVAAATDDAPGDAGDGGVDAAVDAAVDARPDAQPDGGAE